MHPADFQQHLPGICSLKQRRLRLPSSMKSLTGKPAPCRGTTVEVHHLHEIKTLPQLVRRSSREPTWT